jgi:hypothetical protein
MVTFMIAVFMPHPMVLADSGDVSCRRYGHEDNLMGAYACHGDEAYTHASQSAYTVGANASAGVICRGRGHGCGCPWHRFDEARPHTCHGSLTDLAATQRNEPPAANATATAVAIAAVNGHDAVADHRNPAGRRQAVEIHHTPPPTNHG